MTDNEERALESTPRYFDCSPDTWLTLAFALADDLQPAYDRSDGARVETAMHIFRFLHINAPAIRAGSRACGGCYNQYLHTIHQPNHEPQGDTGGI